MENLAYRNAVEAVVNRGWKVLPLHAPTNDLNGCTCGNPTCSSPGKHPRTVNGVKDATDDLTQIKKWSERWPGCNWGAASGGASGFIAVDADGETGLRNWSTLANALDLTDRTLTIRSGGGGLHVLYEQPPNGSAIRNSAGKLAENVDVRGDGGLIVLPGSQHKSGGTYEVETDAALEPMPPELLKKLCEPKEETLDESDGPIPHGSRNDTLARFAGSIRNSGLSGAEIAGALHVINQNRCKPPLPDAEVEAIARGMERYKAKTPIDIPQPALNRFVGVTAAELLSMELPEVEWTVSDVVPEGLTLLAGKPKIGKSWAVYDMALAIVSKNRAFGRFHTAHGSVLYLALEDNQRRLQRRLNAPNKTRQRVVG